MDQARFRSDVRVVTGLALFLLLSASPSLAARRVQAPDAPWRTIPTEHYRIHYPSAPGGGFEDFAREVASKIEGIHARVTEWVGFEEKGPIHVVLRDPVGESNGLALPLVGRPVVELWKTVPESDSAIGHLTSWVDLLVTHELAHIHHLMRPQHEPDLRERLVRLPAGPLALKAPRWVTEGYATLVEGRVTGSGRPSSPYRAALLRAWAIDGKLPGYDEVSRTGGYRGGGMAYLVGSAFLEWLERRSPDPPDVLKRFWKQLASRRRRGFEKSFVATFGIRPKDAYDRFRAEVTHDALELEVRMKASGLREGERWARLEGDVTDLAVSPDGKRLLARVVQRSSPGLRVWDLVEPEKGKSKRQKVADAVAASPDEPEDVPPEFPVRKARWTLPRIDGSVPQRALWLDRERVAFVLKEPDSEGVLVRRPYVWQPGGTFERDPSGRATSPPFRVERDGVRFVAVTAAGRVTLPLEPAGPVRTDAAGSFLYGAATIDGIWNIFRVPLRKEAGGLGAGPAEILTRTVSAAWNPAPAPDGKTLFFTRLSARGTEIRTLDLGKEPLPAAAPPSLREALAPGTVLAPPDGTGVLPPAVEPPASHPYRPGESLWIRSRSGFSITPSGSSYQLGLGGSDLLGRVSWQLLGAIGDAAGPRGAAAGLAWRGQRWAPAMELFSSLERPSAQRFVAVDGLDRQRVGAELSLTFEDRGTIPYQLRPHVALERSILAEGSGESLNRSLVGLDLRVARSWSRGDWGLSATLNGTAQLGRTWGESWSLFRGAATLGLGTPVGRIAGLLEAGSVSGSPSPLDSFGLGGVTTSLVPVSLDAWRVAQPALPSYLSVGDRMLRLRAQLGRAARVYVEHVAVWHGSERPAFERVLGGELVVDELLGEPVIQSVLGRLGFTLGLHRPLDGVMRGRTVGTATLVVKP